MKRIKLIQNQNRLEEKRRRTSKFQFKKRRKLNKLIKEYKKESDTEFDNLIQYGLREN